MENMELYNAFRAVPEEAKKPIQAGRLKGMTDINPMWRIKRLTERFGPCGKGWKYDIIRREFVPGAGGEMAVILDILLFYRLDTGEWSDGIPGTGGSMYIANERNGLHTDDEAPKKALTDAISVAAKALGIGADVYFERDRTKYYAPPAPPPEEPPMPEAPPPVCEDCGQAIRGVKHGEKVFAPKSILESSMRTYGAALCWDCCMKRKAARDAGAN